MFFSFTLSNTSFNVTSEFLLFLNRSEYTLTHLFYRSNMTLDNVSHTVIEISNR